MVELVKSVVDSYRQFPLFLFQFQTKFRNESRIRGGLIRTREFEMKDAYSFHSSFTDLNNFFPKVFAAYERIFQLCQVPAIPAEAAVGFMMGDRSFEFVMPCESGDDLAVRCGGCGYTANQDVAVGVIDRISEPPETVQRVETGANHTMRELSKALSVPKSRLAKTMVYSSGDELVLAVVRGDQEVSVEKLSRSMENGMLHLADREELEYFGLMPDFVSPVGLPPDVMGLDIRLRIVVDEVVADTPNLVIAANEAGAHLTNTNFGRDFESDTVLDIAKVLPGARCRHCGGNLQAERVLEVGNILRLGDYYSRRMNLSFNDRQGRKFFPAMGSYGIRLGRLMAAVVEANHDRRGIVWPTGLAPYRYFLMGIGRSAKVTALADALHDELGDDVLYDDRRESISTKFKDADLIGVPYRVILSPRTAEQGRFEVLARRTGRLRRIPVEGARLALDDLTKEKL